MKTIEIKGCSELQILGFDPEGGRLSLFPACPALLFTVTVQRKFLKLFSVVETFNVPIGLWFSDAKLQVELVVRASERRRPVVHPSDGWVVAKVISCPNCTRVWEQPTLENIMMEGPEITRILAGVIEVIKEEVGAAHCQSSVTSEFELRDYITSALKIGH